MDIQIIVNKVIANLREGYDWNRLICSFTKEELKEFVISEDFYMSNAKGRLDSESFMLRLKSENPDTDVHLYIDSDYRGITERIKHFFLYKEGKVFFGHYSQYDNQTQQWWMSHNHYGLDVNYCGNDTEELRRIMTAAALKIKEYFVGEAEDVYLVLRLFDNVNKVF